ncbi:MAG: MbcA/ParS/Xre antitoxin family protein [Nitratireductor sp.]|jgi:hypothetical protein|nr:MbcA/ParS/Xre antitoxin family protein [Nitratireductor sp.]
MQKAKRAPQPASQASVVTKAVTRAAENLGLPAKVLAKILGVSEATVSRMRHGDHLLEQGGKPFELALLFIRIFRSLDAVTGGDMEVAKRWLTNQNTAFGEPPQQRLLSVAGLFDVMSYLDARRARI